MGVGEQGPILLISPFTTHTHTDTDMYTHTCAYACKHTKRPKVKSILQCMTLVLHINCDNVTSQVSICKFKYSCITSLNNYPIHHTHTHVYTHVRIRTHTHTHTTPQSEINPAVHETCVTLTVIMCDVTGANLQIQVWLNNFF